MGPGHHRSIGSEAEGPIQRLAPDLKVIALLGFVLAVVATPTRAVWAFGVDAVLVLGVVAIAGLPPRPLARRLTIELPFVAFALLLPFAGRGDQVTVAGLSLSVAGLWAMWGILAKATLATAASVVLAATTPVADLLDGLDRLRLPRVLTAIAGFMVRYLDVTTDQVRRMSIARVSRGDDPRWIWQARATAASAGTLFVRSLERGERVHLAMVARGYDGHLPRVDPPAPHRRSDAARALAVPAAAWGICLAAWWWLGAA